MNYKDYKYYCYLIDIFTIELDNLRQNYKLELQNYKFYKLELDNSIEIR